MKTAIYIEDGTVQLVLTPQNEFEKTAMRSFDDNVVETKIFRGSFYDCRGGWVRQTEVVPEDNLIHPSQDTADRSLIIRMSKTHHRET